MGDKVKVTQMLSCGPKISQAEVDKKCGCSQPQVPQAKRNMELILQQWKANLNPNYKRKRGSKTVPLRIHSTADSLTQEQRQCPC